MGMSRERKSSAAPILAVLALGLVISLSAYAAGYFWLGEYEEISAGGSALPRQVNIIDRAYPQQWVAIAFRPAARFEGWLRGVLVVTRQADARSDSQLPPLLHFFP
jgi:hypothetical protein